MLFERLTFSRYIYILIFFFRISFIILISNQKLKISLRTRNSFVYYLSWIVVIFSTRIHERIHGFVENKSL